MAGPLEGVKVLDLSQVVSGPLAAAWLADQGAEVVKVETKGLGDIGRWVGPRKEDVSALFLTVNRGKKSVALDLKNSDRHRALLDALIADADVLVENFRPGAMARLGLEPAMLLKKHPRLIICSITGFGPKGPYAQGRVYDPLIQAASGHAAAQRDPATGDPKLIQTIVCDKTTGLAASQAITAALYAREKTGAGQHVEISMLDTAVAFLWADGLYNETFLENDAPPYPDLGAFYHLWRTSDGWVALASVQDAEYAATCRALDRPDLIEDPRFESLHGRVVNHKALTEILKNLISARTTEDVLRRMAEEDAPAAPVNDRSTLFEDPQLEANGSIVEFEHGALGPVRQARHPARFSGAPCDMPRPAPRLGADTEALLSKYLG